MGLRRNQRRTGITTKMPVGRAAARSGSKHWAHPSSSMTDDAIVIAVAQTGGNDLTKMGRHHVHA
jgi:hypothetical protein